MNENPTSNRLAVSLPLILAQRLLDLFEESGATPQEQKLALDIVHPQVAEKAYGVTSFASQQAPSEDH